MLLTYLLKVSADTGIRSLSVKNNRTFTRNGAKYGEDNKAHWEQRGVIHFRENP